MRRRIVWRQVVRGPIAWMLCGRSSYVYERYDYKRSIRSNPRSLGFIRRRAHKLRT